MSMPITPLQMRELATLRESHDQRGLNARLSSLTLPTSPEMLYHLGGHFSHLGRHAEALKIYDLCLKRGGDNPGAFLARSQTRMFTGDVSGCVDDLTRALRMLPNMAIAWLQLAKMGVRDGRDSRITQLRRLLDSGNYGGRPEGEAQLAYALHLELDGAGEYGAAWDALQRGARAKRRLLKYAAGDTTAAFDRLMSFDWALPEASGGTTEEWAPVFVLGMYRSGTTLLEQMLTVSPEVVGAGELTQIEMGMRRVAGRMSADVSESQILAALSSPDAMARAGDDYRSQVSWRLQPGAQFITDKMPRNFAYIGWILHALPEAKIILTERDPMEVAFSNLRELFAGATNAHSYDADELASHYIDYVRITDAWKSPYGDRIHVVNYRDLTAKPGETIGAVADYLGLERMDEMADPRNSRRSVATASSVEVRDAVVQRAKPKYANYPEFIEVYGPRLESVIASFEGRSS